MLYDAESGNLTITAGGDAMITRKLSVHEEENFLNLVNVFSLVPLPSKGRCTSFMGLVPI